MRKSLFLLLSIFVLSLSSCVKKVSEGIAVVRRGAYTYRGEVKNGLYDGFGVLSLKDSVLYSGGWKAGRRHGEGTTADSLGHEVRARWAADTIVSGTVLYPDGTYVGELDSLCRPSGHGVFRGKDGDFYDGKWLGGKRNGFGCAAVSSGKVMSGEWKNGSYRGERISHTPERIYGIDISRYQHGKGRKKYPIHWDRLRITNLGKISRKEIRGTVSYPVSFVYIKSTEGVSVRNPFYLSDYRQARRHGIVCGAYHFFSPSSPASRQAAYFLKHSRFSRGDMPPVLDVEPSDAQIRKMGGVDAMFSRIRTWLKQVERAVGVRPVLYVSQRFVNKYLPSAPDLQRGYRVWIARYGEYKPDVRLLFWQLCPDGRVSGIRGEVDINVFNGYQDSYKEFLREIKN